MLPMKKNIALIAGGYSGEYEISIASARRIMENIDHDRYQVFLIRIQKESWLAEDADGTPVSLNRTDFTLNLNNGILHFDKAMIIIHGPPGENGMLQGYLDMIGIPYTTCSHDTSAATFNKYYCKLLVKSFGIPLARHLFFTRHHTVNADDIIRELPLPLFVKPNQNGSSVGVRKAKTRESLEEAIAYAFSFDTEILVEETLVGREITCGVLRLGTELVSLPLCEVVSKKEFFDYEAKYSPGMAEERVPAPLTDEVNRKCTEISRFLYEKLNCRGVVRFDYILSGDTFYFLEVNTVPGMSAGSIVPKMVRANGWTEREFYNLLIENQ